MGEGSILVIAEHRDGLLCDSTLEALGLAASLAGSAGLDVETLVLCAEPDGLATALDGLTPRLRVVTDPLLARYDFEPTVEALVGVVEGLGPRLVLLGHSSLGMDLAPALAARLDALLVTDCTSLEISGEGLSATRSCYGGKIVERLDLRSAPLLVATLRGGAFPQVESGRFSGTSRLDDRATELKLPGLRRFVEHVVAEAADVDITAADRLVSVGRGIGSEENIAMAEALAEAMGATLSCSRPVADAGWMPQSRQVGTSGSTVRPKLYVALGISGAFQHVAGMSGAETILAVNKDPSAPIFGVAHFGIVADVVEVIPALTAELRRNG